MGRLGLRRYLTACTACCLLLSCNGLRAISSDRLLTLFNEGGTDSFPDLELTPDAIARERVVVTTRHSLSRAFFSQGLPPMGDTAADWFGDDAVRAAAREHVARLTDKAKGRRDESCQREQEEANYAWGDETEVDRVFRFSIIEHLGIDPEAGVCEGGKLTESGKRYVDASRFVAGVQLASVDAARMVDERLVTLQQAGEGLDAAMYESGRYTHARRWRPSARAATLGVAIKGGASSGTYSAGAMWRVLTLLQRYATWKRDASNLKQPDLGIDPDEARFVISSGTSAGAIVAAVVDLFHQKKCEIDPRAGVFRKQFNVSGDQATGDACKEYARRLMATVFTCTNQDSLYCIDRRPLWDLVGSQMGLMDFKGLRGLMERHVSPSALINEAELITTTVDFRWGELYILSDQDPSTVPLDPQAPAGTADAGMFMRRNIEASFVLPFIARPVAELWIEGARRRGVFLDGGVKSEIPILSLGQRGIEHALVIGSGPTKITPTAPQKNAASIASRYLDISLSAVTEGEWNAVLPYARHIESKEREACEQLFELAGKTPPPKFCEGDFARACGDRAAPSRRFETLGIFRPETVDPSFGYSFDEVHMRRLFNAGAESVRERCPEIANFLGLRDASPDLLDAWCNETPVTEQTLCKLGDEEAKPCAD